MNEYMDCEVSIFVPVRRVATSLNVIRVSIRESLPRRMEVTQQQKKIKNDVFSNSLAFQATIIVGDVRMLRDDRLIL